MHAFLIIVVLFIMVVPQKIKTDDNNQSNCSDCDDKESSPDSTTVEMTTMTNGPRGTSSISNTKSPSTTPTVATLPSSTIGTPNTTSTTTIKASELNTSSHGTNVTKGSARADSISPSTSPTHSTLPMTMTNTSNITTSTMIWRPTHTNIMIDMMTASGMKTSAIIGGICGTLGVVLLLVFLILAICFIKNRKRPVRRLKKSTSINPGYREFPSMEVQFPDNAPPDVTYSSASADFNGTHSVYEEIDEQHRTTVDLHERYVRQPSLRENEYSLVRHSPDEVDSKKGNPTYDNFAYSTDDRSDAAVDVEHDDTILIDNHLYGVYQMGGVNNPSVPPVVNDDTILVENDLYSDD